MIMVAMRKRVVAVGRVFGGGGAAAAARRMWVELETLRIKTLRYYAGSRLDRANTKKVTAWHNKQQETAQKQDISEDLQEYLGLKL
jgi:hypothetical protein